MSNNHLYARRKSDGNKVFIDDVPNGKKCGCICSKCHEPLIAKNGGEINIHHFAHISDSNCPGESSAHIEAKDIIKREKYLWRVLSLLKRPPSIWGIAPHSGTTRPHIPTFVGFLFVG